MKVFWWRKKRNNEIFQMMMLILNWLFLMKPIQVLDIDALRIVADGVNAFKMKEMQCY